MWGCFLMSGVKILHFLKDWWKSIPIHQNYTMALIPKEAKSIFDQNRVTDITTLFSLPPTFRTHFWSEYSEQREDIVN